MQTKNIQRVARIMTCILVLLFGLGTIVSLAYADDVDNTSTSTHRAEVRDRLREQAERIQEKQSQLQNRTEQKREEMQNAANERREAAENRLEERRQKLDGARQHRIDAYVSRIIKRMYAAAERLNDIANRIALRIEKFEEEKGFDLSEAKRLLEVAKEKIDSATLKIEEVAEALRGVLVSDSPREDFEAIRTLFNEAKQSLKEAHAALVQSVRAIKASAGKDRNADTGSDGEDGEDGTNGEDGANGTTTPE